MENSKPANPSLYPPCALCGQPLPPEEIRLTREWHWDCEKCSICGEEMHGIATRIEKCIATGEPLSHTVCKDAAAIAEIRNQKIPFTRTHLQAMNNEILTMRHAAAPPVSDVELLFGFLKDLQELAANVSWVLKLTRDKISIEDSQEYAEKVKRERKAKAETDAVKAVEDQKTAERAAMLAAERANPKLRERRKAIEGIMKAFSFTEEQATAMLDKQAGGTQ